MLNPGEYIAKIISGDNTVSLQHHVNKHVVVERSNRVEDFCVRRGIIYYILGEYNTKTKTVDRYASIAGWVVSSFDLKFITALNRRDSDGL